MQRIRDELRRARLPALALFTAFVLGALIIVLTDFEHLRQIPVDPLAANLTRSLWRLRPPTSST